MTINKGQGQENERVGLDLPSPVFAHGQLYTGMSRGKNIEISFNSVLNAFFQVKESPW